PASRRWVPWPGRDRGWPAGSRCRPAVTRFPLAEAAAAHRALENRRTTGKVVLEP
ncbi:zinc-binding dehydrogenase, partial [Streptomyces sp. 900105245]